MKNAAPPEKRQTDEATPEPVEDADDNHTLPLRFQKARYRVFADAMPDGWAGDLSKWLSDHRELLEVGGHGAGRFNFEILDLAKHYDTAPVHKRLMEALDDETLAACDVKPFDLDRIEMHLTLYHNGCFFDFHDDTPGGAGELVETRALTFCYYMHAKPRMFQGGELEFMAGTVIDPENDTLVLFNPLQQHRIKRVDCWSNDMMHGRWALTGWYHSRRELRHYDWDKLEGACPGPTPGVGGTVTPAPQDVTCERCREEIMLALDKHVESP